MDLQYLFNLVMPITLLACGWFLRELWTAVQELKDDLAHLKENIPVMYMRKDEFAGRWNELLDFMRRIEDKIDRKMDR